MTSPVTQLDLVHIDAHGDFSGFIDPGVHVFLMKQLLLYSPEQRPYLIDKNRSRMTLANYMSFAVACRWIRRIEFVTHPNWKQDVYDVFFRGKNPASGLIEFCTPAGQAEPSVPITFTPKTRFSQAGFTHAFLSQSPNYTPITADQLSPSI
jgi:hypothetical protein